jgi:hypothetical protein
MSEFAQEKLLVFIRGLIAICTGVVVAMLTLALAFWLQPQLVESMRHDSLASILSFLASFLMGGLATGLANWARHYPAVMLHSLLFLALYLAMFIGGWIRNEDIGAGLIAGLVFGGLVLAPVGSAAGLWLRLVVLRRRG